MQIFSTLQKVLRLIFLLILVNLVGYIANAYITPQTIQWYHSLVQSCLTPPDIVFGIVWSILLTMQAIAAFLVWQKVSPRLFCLQLSLNMLWSFSFFYLKNPTIALGVLLLFLLALWSTIKGFSKRNLTAAYLMFPTLLWGIFAVYLNSFIVFALVQ